MPVAKALKADQCNTSCSFLSGPAMVTGFVGHAKKWDCDCKRVAQAYKKAHTVGLGLFLIWCRVPCNQNWQCHIKSSLKYLLWISIVFFQSRMVVAVSSATLNLSPTVLLCGTPQLFGTPYCVHVCVGRNYTSCIWVCERPLGSAGCQYPHHRVYA